METPSRTRFMDGKPARAGWMGKVIPFLGLLLALVVLFGGLTIVGRMSNRQPSSHDTQVSEDRTGRRTLPTGTRISDDIGIDGHGRLVVDNGTDSDAVVRLVKPFHRNASRWFFVKSHETGQVDGIEPGTYQILYSMGNDWDEQKEEFEQDTSYGRFEKEAVFREDSDDEGGLHYESLTITLHKVFTGTARTSTISRTEFLGN